MNGGTPHHARMSSSPDTSGAEGGARDQGVGRAIAAVAAGALMLAGTFWVYHGAHGGKFLHVDWMLCLLWLLPVWLLARQPSRHGEPPPAAGYGRLAAPLAFMGVYLFSSSVRDPWFFLLDWVRLPGPQAPGPVCLLDVTVTATALLWTLLILRPGWASSRSLWVLLLLAQAMALFNLMDSTGGAPLYRDDHPSFLYRLWQFGVVAPRSLTYDPHWNGGVVGSVLADTGVKSIGLLWWPLWRWFPTEALYTPLVGITFILVVPWLTAASARVAGLSRATAACAAILSLGFSNERFLWLLHFGTIGSALAGSFLIPFSAGLYRAFILDRRDLATAAWIAASGYMLVQWPPGILMGAAAAASILVFPRAWTWRKIAFLAVCAIATAALDWHGILGLWINSRDNISYTLTAAPGQPARGLVTTVRHIMVTGLSHLFSQANRAHPLVIFGGIAGLAAITDRRLARWFVPPLALLALLAGWGPILLPKLQLGRMTIPMLQMALLPAAVLVGEVVGGAPSRRPRARLWPALALALLGAGAWSTARIYGNAGPAPYVKPEAQVRDLVALIARDCPPGARVMFAGRTVHAYGGGHVAALPLMAGREMLACDYYAFPMDQVEYEYPPREFRRTPEGVRAFLALYNVGLIVTHHPKWVAYFNEHPELAEPLAGNSTPGSAFHVFRVPSPPGLFAQGAGRVRARFNRLDVDLDDAHSEATLRYNWDDRLRADGGAELFPVDAAHGVRLIGLRPNGRRTVVIRLPGWL